MGFNPFYFRETKDGRLHLITLPQRTYVKEYHNQKLIPVTIDFLNCIYEGYFSMKDIHMEKGEKESLSFVLENRVLSIHIHIAENEVCVTHTYKA